MTQIINSLAQRYAEIISNSLGAEVTIIDSNNTRIAGTGEFKSKVGSKIPDFFVSSQVIKSGKSQAVFFNEGNIMCERCPQKCSFQEKGFICVPLIDNDRILGAISIICFDNEQIKLLMSKQENILSLISSIGELLILKTKEEEYINKLELSENQLNSIFSSINDGLLLLDSDGNINNCSNSISKSLGVSKEQLIGKRFKELTDYDVNINRLENDIEFSEIKFKGKNKTFEFSSSPFIINGKFGGSVIVLVEDSKINPLIYRKIHDSRQITFDNIMGQSSKLKDTINLAKKASKVDANLLIIGESGTGKELFARSIHNHGLKNKAPFISVNCAAIPDALLESELFGYEGGAFTGARKTGKPGKFELANGGTIFLDEIGDMPLHLQVKLLRVIQENEIERIGGTYPIKINARVIAATNKDLKELVNNKQFREDLYYRLNVIQLKIPPLRERKEDIPLLIDYFMNKYCDHMEIHKKTISKQAMNLLCNYEWKGNIRELQNTIEYICCICSGQEVACDDITEKLQVNTNVEESEGIMPINSLERKEIIKALETFGYTTEGKLNAAKTLGMSKSTLYRKLKEYKI